MVKNAVVIVCLNGSFGDFYANLLGNGWAERVRHGWVWASLVITKWPSSSSSSPHANTHTHFSRITSLSKKRQNMFEFRRWGNMCRKFLRVFSSSETFFFFSRF